MGRKTVERIPNNLKYMRVRRGMSIGTLSQLTSIPTTTLHRLENGQPIEPHHMKPLCRELRCKPDEIREPTQEAKAVYIVGLLKYSDSVTMLPKEKWKSVPALTGLGEQMRALRVVGDLMKPNHPKNALLYFHETPEKNPSGFLERECMVEMPGRKRPLLCWVSKGSKKGLYTLYPRIGMRIMHDEKVVAAYPILHAEHR